MESHSYARREALKKAEKDLHHINVSNLCPIDRYYTASEKLLSGFNARYDVCQTSGNIGSCSTQNEQMIDDAYVYGRRYVMFVSQVLPKHDYFLSSSAKYVQRRNKAMGNAKSIMDKMGILIDFMDMQEKEKIMLEEEIERKRRVAEEKEKERDKENELQQKLQNLLSIAPKDDVEKNGYSESKGAQPLLPPPSYEEFLVNENDKTPLPLPLPSNSKYDSRSNETEEFLLPSAPPEFPSSTATVPSIPISSSLSGKVEYFYRMKLTL